MRHRFRLLCIYGVLADSEQATVPVLLFLALLLTRHWFDSCNASGTCAMGLSWYISDSIVCDFEQVTVSICLCVFCFFHVGIYIYIIFTIIYILLVLYYIWYYYFYSPIAFASYCSIHICDCVEKNFWKSSSTVTNFIFICSECFSQMVVSIFIFSKCFFQLILSIFIFSDWFSKLIVSIFIFSQYFLQLILNFNFIVKYDKAFW